ncbi:glutamate--tRNA ligase [Peptoniphilus sp. KCTC 25270]|uniref:glutamate--tRNA ligase n=1 Tax=Peptoniphilus sp. KCTC 25270 TaxID=2897414 RepID=UPI001E58D77A|nr:glutamate--tRNA ligase [Peptoniphilus sp. KCTC 25270]MCD1146712.1 glutamate--tRNA ligase [Peptoniphilus sp. KCTC 25270]
MSEVRVRFAPSPTGYLHIGGLRTAVYNYLYAKQNNGKFLLRIEDTDQTRLVEGAIENLIASLQWSGVEIDEGVLMEDGKVVQKGECGPYIQSERLDIYKKYVDQLIEEGHAYYCFCTKERLDNLREGQKMKGQVPRYDGLCRNIPLDEARERIANGEEYVVRLKLPHDRDIKFRDEVRGDIVINTNEMDDQVLMKSDGFPTYHLAVVVDDHLMGITHIVRGEEWLPSTPKHVYLYEAFGWEQPTYVHLPGVLNSDHKKLSKRQGDVSVEDFKGHGYLPEGLVNYLALVGWSPESNEELFTMEELIEQFNVKRVAKTGGVFDKKKLDWVNSHYMKKLSREELGELAFPYMEKAGYVNKEFVENNKEKYLVLMETIQDSLDRLEQAPEQSTFLFEEYKVTEEEAIEQLKGETAPDVIQGLEEALAEVDEIDQEFAKGLMKKVQKAKGVKGKNLFMPARAAMTGNVHGPDLTSIIYLLGKEEILNRLEKAKSYMN